MAFNDAVLWMSVLVIQLGCSVADNNPTEATRTPIEPAAVRWLTPPQERTREENRAVVRAALAVFPVGTYRASFDDSEYCSPRGNYTLERRADGFHLWLNLRLEAWYGTPDRRERQLVELVRACIPAVQARWAQYDIALHIATDGKPGVPTTREDITLVDEAGTSNAGRYYMQGQTTPLCTVLDHEWGHLLGLVDEYYKEDGPCGNDAPAAAIGDPYPSVMAAGVLELDDSEFQPRHLRSLFAHAAPTLVRLVPRRPLRDFRDMLFLDGRLSSTRPDRTDGWRVPPELGSVTRPWCIVWVHYDWTDGDEFFQSVRDLDRPWTGRHATLFCNTRDVQAIPEILGSRYFKVLVRPPLFADTALD